MQNNVWEIYLEPPGKGMGWREKLRVLELRGTFRSPQETRPLYPSISQYLHEIAPKTSDLGV